MGCTENEDNNESDNESNNGGNNNSTIIYFDILASRGVWINFTLLIDNNEVYHDNFFEEFKDDEQLPLLYNGSIETENDSISIKVTRKNSSGVFQGWYNISDGNYFAIYIYSDGEDDMKDVGIIQRLHPIYYE